MRIVGAACRLVVNGEMFWYNTRMYKYPGLGIRLVVLILAFLIILGGHVIVWYFLWDADEVRRHDLILPIMFTAILVFFFGGVYPCDEYRLRDAIALCVVALLAQITALGISLATLFPGEPHEGLYARGWSLIQPDQWWSYWEQAPNLVGAFILSCGVSIWAAIGLWSIRRSSDKESKS